MTLSVLVALCLTALISITQSYAISVDVEKKKGDKLKIKEKSNKYELIFLPNVIADADKPDKGLYFHVDINEDHVHHSEWKQYVYSGYDEKEKRWSFAQIKDNELDEKQHLEDIFSRMRATGFFRRHKSDKAIFENLFKEGKVAIFDENRAVFKELKQRLSGGWFKDRVKERGYGYFYTKTHIFTVKILQNRKKENLWFLQLKDFNRDLFFRKKGKRKVAKSTTLSIPNQKTNKKKGSYDDHFGLRFKAGLGQNYAAKYKFEKYDPTKKKLIFKRSNTKSESESEESGNTQKGTDMELSLKEFMVQVENGWIRFVGKQLDVQTMIQQQTGLDAHENVYNVYDVDDYDYYNSLQNDLMDLERKLEQIELDKWYLREEKKEKYEESGSILLMDK